MGVRTPAEGRPWLKYYDEGVSPSIDYPQIPLDRLLANSAVNHPEHVALIFGARVGSRILDKALAYRDLDAIVDRFAAGLQELGIDKGHRVAILAPNCPQFVIAFYGALRAGGVAVPCNFLYSATELRHQLNDSGAEIILTLSPYYEKVRSIRASTRLRHVVVTNIKE